MNRLTVLALALAAAGCTTTLADVRATPPIREATIATARPRPEVAACTMDGLETSKNGRGMVFRLLNRTPEQTSLTGTPEQTSLTGSLAESTVFEAMFSSEGDRLVVQTHVDGPSIYPAFGWLARKVEREDFWPIVERCAGTAIAVRPPF